MQFGSPDNGTSVTLDDIAIDREPLPGSGRQLTVTVTNHSSVVQRLALRLSSDHTWLRGAVPAVTIVPGDSSVVAVPLNVPRDAPAILHEFVIEAVDADTLDAIVERPFRLPVSALVRPEVSVEPERVALQTWATPEIAGRVRVANNGNATARFRIVVESDDAVEVIRSADRLELAPGQVSDVDLDLELRSRRFTVREPHTHEVLIRAEPEGAELDDTPLRIDPDAAGTVLSIVDHGKVSLTGLIATGVGALLLLAAALNFLLPDDDAEVAGQQIIRGEDTSETEAPTTTREATGASSSTTTTIDGPPSTVLIEPAISLGEPGSTRSTSPTTAAPATPDPTPPTGNPTVTTMPVRTLVVPGPNTGGGSNSGGGSADAATTTEAVATTAPPATTGGGAAATPTNGKTATGGSGPGPYPGEPIRTWRYGDARLLRSIDPATSDLDLVPATGVDPGSGTCRVFVGQSGPQFVYFTVNGGTLVRIDNRGNTNLTTPSGIKIGDPESKVRDTYADDIADGSLIEVWVSDPATRFAVESPDKEKAVLVFTFSEGAVSSISSVHRGRTSQDVSCPGG